MRKFKFNIKDNPYEVEILDVDGNIAQVNVNGKVYEVEVDKQLQTTKTPKLVRSFAPPSTDSVPSISKTSSPNAPKGTGNVKSPLPGVILSVHVKVGAKIAIGDRLLVLEAMKMENNINSDKEGIVKEIKVKKGDSVLEGDLLIVIES